MLKLTNNRYNLLQTNIDANNLIYCLGTNFAHSFRTPSHPLDHTITTIFYLFSRHHAINLLQFAITPINLDLPLDFYGSACRKYFENTFSSSFQQ